MKVYVEIELLEKNIFRAKEQAHFLRCTLESVDVAVQHVKKQLDRDIANYNKRAEADQKVLDMHEKNIVIWTGKLDKLYSKQIKKIDKEKVKVIIEKSEKQLRKEVLKVKKRQLAEDLKKAKEQIELIDAVKELEKEEEAEIIEDIIEEDITVEVEIDSSKVECPECHEQFTKGGAFSSHYKSHFPNGKE